jgi:aromatic ring-opening dioxygenase LigB subunit
MEQFAIKTQANGNFKATILVKLPINTHYAKCIKNISNEELLLLANVSRDCIHHIKNDSYYQFLVVGGTTRDVAVIMQEHKIELALCKARGITHMI